MVDESSMKSILVRISGYVCTKATLVVLWFRFSRCTSSLTRQNGRCNGSSVNVNANSPYAISHKSTKLKKCKYCKYFLNIIDVYTGK